MYRRIWSHQKSAVKSKSLKGLKSKVMSGHIELQVKCHVVVTESSTLTPKVSLVSRSKINISNMWLKLIECQV